MSEERRKKRYAISGNNAILWDDKQNGSPLRVEYTVPISFRLQ